MLNLQFQELNFGDGTGFVTTAGEPVNMRRKIGGTGAAIQPDRPPNPKFDKQYDGTSSELLLTATFRKGMNLSFCPKP